MKIVSTDHIEWVTWINNLNLFIKKKVIQCTDCEYRSSQKGALNQYVKSGYEANKPFKCEDYGYRSSQKLVNKLWSLWLILLF